ncbi:hypothetical protein EHO61_06330 [Leptospira fluminis]|uniref:Yip1 domain-containing protein n=1 Tax=Leptospira fluminis TaxID=2484979 RepID=A0A4R9GSJ8_9LEPT|nr:hypothetical protein [Leptospira fluminis]TGK20116.1 hypothetical protein EHO61_06330 [Leptospira fluminis]
MLDSIPLKLKNIFQKEKLDILSLIRDKTPILEWTNPALKSGFMRYTYVFEFAGLLNTVNILIDFFYKGTTTNTMVEDLYAQKEIGGLLYFFSHFPQNIFGFFLFWTFLPVFTAAIWNLAFWILNGKEKEAQKPFLALLSLNTLFFPMVGIAIQQITTLLKLVLIPNRFFQIGITVFWAVFTIGILGTSIVYSVKAFHNRYDQPIGRAVILTLSPILLFIALISYFAR